MKKLKDLFNTVTAAFRRAEEKTLNIFRAPETKTFVAFTIAGEGKPRLSEVKDRDVKTLEIPAQATAFQYFEAEVKPGRVYDDVALLKKASRQSDTYYFADRVLSLREYQNMDYEAQHKLTGFYNQSSWEDTHLAIEGNVARCMNSRWNPHEIAINRTTRARIFPPERAPLMTPRKLKV